MLTTYLSNNPLPKFVLLEDTITTKASDILKALVNHVINIGKCKIIYFVTEGNISALRKAHRNVEFIDCRQSIGKLEEYLSTQTNEKSIIVINSFSHLTYGLSHSKLFKLLHSLKRHQDIKQILGTLHLDLLQNSNDWVNHFEYLSTISIKLLGRDLGKPRLLFTYKKTTGKIVCQYEEYSILNGDFISEPIKKIDAKALIQEGIQEVKPETLTTFKISLDDKEKQDRDQLVLPYLPKKEQEPSTGGQIFYQFDAADDWDEEDPDDDLNF